MLFLIGNEPTLRNERLKCMGHESQSNGFAIAIRMCAIEYSFKLLCTFLDLRSTVCLRSVLHFRQQTRRSRLFALMANRQLAAINVFILSRENSGFDI